MNPVITRLKNIQKAPMNLLLLADPSKDMIKRYLEKGDIYIALSGNETIGVYVLIKKSQDSIELMNIAVKETFQKQGVGKRLILDAIQRAKGMGAKRIEVSTGNSSLNQLALYQKCGFRIVEVESDFFTKNYPNVIEENGIKCIDKINLSQNL